MRSVDLCRVGERTEHDHRACACANNELRELMRMQIDCLPLSTCNTVHSTTAASIRYARGNSGGTAKACKCVAAE